MQLRIITDKTNSKKTKENNQTENDWHINNKSINQIHSIGSGALTEDKI